MDEAQQLLAYLQGEQAEMIAFLEALARAESPSTEPSTQAAVQVMLRERLEAVGFVVELIPGEKSGGHLYARPAASRERGPRQLLLGHTDTVWPRGTLADMPVAVEGDRIAGPGVYDMKAGLVQMVFALRALDALGLKPTVAPELFLNSDEEVGSGESTPHIRRLAAEAERVFVLEPSLGTAGKLKTARKGVGYFRIHLQGKAAHAGLAPEEGRSAILALAHVIQQLDALNDPAAGITVNVGTVAGGLRANVVAAGARAEVDVRVPDQAGAERVTAALEKLNVKTPGVTLTVTGAIDRPPLERTARNRALWRLARSLGRQLGVELEEGSAGGGSDGNTASQYAATLDGLGAVGDGAHAAHEFVFIESLAERAALLALLLLSPSLGGSKGV